jgi:hypothetical protein
MRHTCNLTHFRFVLARELCNGTSYKDAVEIALREDTFRWGLKECLPYAHSVIKN